MSTPNSLLGDDVKTILAAPLGAAVLLGLGMTSFTWSDPQPNIPPQTPRKSLMPNQLTHSPHGHILTNSGVWSPDSLWLYYDVRSDPAGSVFDGNRIERVNVETGEVQVIYTSTREANCGVVTAHPTDDQIVFILGPEDPSEDWSYSAFQRQGVLVNPNLPNVKTNLDARNLVAPFTQGALRGGTHLHTFCGDGSRIAFTYEDHPIAMNYCPKTFPRNIGVSVLGKPVTVPNTHARNHDGSAYSVLVTRTVEKPTPGSDEIERASEESWIGQFGYLKPDGTRQNYALAFQGRVATENGTPHNEVFVVDLPEDLTQTGTTGPLMGDENLLPQPPLGVSQRRLTNTDDRKYPGIQGPRHWLKSSNDGQHIAFLMKDDNGIVQLYTINPNGGEPVQRTHQSTSIESAFSWHCYSKHVAYIMDGSVCVTQIATGVTQRLTEKSEMAPRPEACVFSPNGRYIAYVQAVKGEGGIYNQIFVVEWKP